MHCSTGFGKKLSPHLNAALQTRLTASLSHCKYTNEHLLSIQACSHPTPMHCSAEFGKKLSPLHSAALQTRLPAAFCHCKYTNGRLLSIQACSHPTPMHCSAELSKKLSPLHSAALQTRLPAAFCHCNTPMNVCSPYRLAVTQHQCTAALDLARSSPLCTVLLCKPGCQQPSATAIHQWTFALHTGLQSPNTNALQR